MMGGAQKFCIKTKNALTPLEHVFTSYLFTKAWNTHCKMRSLVKHVPLYQRMYKKVSLNFSQASIRILRNQWVYKRKKIWVANFSRNPQQAKKWNKKMQWVGHTLNLRITQRNGDKKRGKSRKKWNEAGLLNIREIQCKRIKNGAKNREDWIKL